MTKQAKRFYQFDSFLVDENERVLLRNGKPVPLPPKVFETLLALVRESGHIVEKETLIKRIWPDTFVEENNLSQYISTLRKALGNGQQDQQYIETIPRRGYRFADVVREAWTENGGVVAATQTKVNLVVKEETEEFETDAPGVGPGQIHSARHIPTIKDGRLPAAARVRHRMHSAILAMTIVAIATSGVAFGLYKFIRRDQTAADPSATRFFITPPEKVKDIIVPVVSPDGRRLIFSAIGPDGKPLLWMRSLDSLNAFALPGTDNAVAPFWSPDSSSIGFFGNGKLKTINLSSMQVQSLASAPLARGGAWGRDGMIIFAPSQAGGLYRVSVAGGATDELTTLDQSGEETAHLFPFFLPDGRHFLYLVQSEQRAHRGIYVSSLDSKNKVRVLDVFARAEYAPPGYLLFVRGRTLMAQTFDVNAMAATGEPIPVAERVASGHPVSLQSLFSVSQNGVLVYQISEDRQLVWIDRRGKRLGSVGDAGGQMQPMLSPDGKLVAMIDLRAGNYDVWIVDLARGETTRLTVNPVPDRYPVWSPDGSRIVYASSRSGSFDLYQQLSIGTAEVESVLTTKDWEVPSDWSADGRYLVYQTIGPKTGLDVWVLPLFGDRKPFPFLQSESYEDQAQLSPDGRWIAYTSDESGSREVYVRRFPEANGTWKVSTGGGSQPRWRRDGKELFYLTTGNTLMMAEVATDGSSFVARVPVPLFEARVGAFSSGLDHYAVSPDGQRFLVNILEDPPPPPITVVLNWTAGLRR